MVDTDFSYHVAVTNHGPQDAHNVLLTDVLPSALTFVELTFDAGDPPTACGIGQTIICSVSLLAAGATMGITLLVHLLANTPDQSLVSNTAGATSATDDPNTGNNSATVRTTAVTPKADLEVSKTGPATAMVDSNFSYHVVVHNAGPQDAHNVQVLDVLPAELSFVSFTSFDAGQPPTGCGLGQTINCSILLLAAGESQGWTFVVHLAANTPDQTQVTNTATASSDTADPVPGNNSGSVTTTAVTPKADLAVSKTGPATAMVDSNFSYHVVVHNAGPQDAHNVQVLDVLPAELSFVSFTSFDAGQPPTGCGLGQTINCSILLLAAGESQGWTFVVHLAANTPDQTQVTNTATASSDTADPVPGNNSGSVTTTAMTPKADLAVTKTGPATAMVDSNFSYHVVVHNAGPQDAHNVQVLDVLPAELSFVSFTSFDAGQPPTGCGLGQTINCSILLLAAGESQGWTFVVHLAANTPDQTQVTNTATASSDTADPVPGNNSGSVTTIAVSRADLAVTKQGPTSAAIGDEISYDITVHNGGPSTAVNVALDEVASSGLQVIPTTGNAGWGCTFPGAQPLRCTAASFAARATLTFTATLQQTPARLQNAAATPTADT